MTVKFYLSTAMLALLSITAYGQMPSYRICENDPSPLCDSLAQANFTDQVIKQAVAQRGYFFNDSIHFKYQIGPEGKIMMEDVFYLHSGQAKLSCELALVKADSLFSESSRGQSFPMAFVFSIPAGFQNFKEVEEVKKPLPIKACKSFNAKAQRACARYLVSLAVNQLRNINKVPGEMTARLYFEKGRLTAIDYTKTPLDKYYNDLIFPIFKEQAESEIDWNQARHADPQWMDFEFSYFEDSTARFDYAHQNLAYLAKLTNKEDFLAAMLETGPEYYKGKEKADFYMNQLSAADLAQRVSFTSSGHVYPIDSIRNYQPKKKEDEEKGKTLSFALVEKVPVYEGCDEDDKNEKLKSCFQQKIIQHVGSTFSFPEEARLKGIQGRCFVGFVIEKDGSIGVIDVVRGTHPLLDYEAIRTISLIPDMKPAMQRDKPVRMSFTLPINARLK